MPATQQWIQDGVLQITWTRRLTSSDISQSFSEIKDALVNTDGIVHLLFDISKAGGIPSQAPMHFIKAEIATQPNLGSIAVIGMDPVAQILAQIAVKMTGQNILFFCEENLAMDYLQVS